MPLQKTPLKYFFLTINFHDNDVLLFDDFISQLLGLIGDDTLIWCIENDNTPKRHFHAVIPNIIKDKHYKDRDKMKQLLLPRLKTYLKKRHNHTEVENTARTKAMNISDVLQDGYLNKEGEDKVGYCAKEFCIRCGGTISPEEKQKHKLIFLNSKKITENTIKNTIEIKTLTIKNALIYMYDFYKTYSPPINSIFSSMVEDGYSFTQLSGNQKDSLRNELKLRLHKEELIKCTDTELKHLKQEIDNHSHVDIYNEYDKLKDDLKTLLQVMKDNPKQVYTQALENIIRDTI